MIRKLSKDDKLLYMEMSERFYASDAVHAPIPAEYRAAAFDEVMRTSVYAQGYLLLSDDAPAGYALTAKTYSQEAGGIVIWLEEIFVMPEFRGRGLAHEFISHVESTEKYARLRLEASPDNVRAIALYERLGFRRLLYMQLIKTPGTR